MRALVEKIKKYYDKGLYTIVQIQQMLDAGKITEEEYYYIIGLEQ